MENAIDLRLPVTTRGDQYMGMLERGQWVHSILYGGRDGIICAIDGPQAPDTIRRLPGVSMGGSACIDVVFKNGSRSHVPESVLRGTQWFISDCIASEDEIRQALDFAEATRMRKEEEQRQKTINRQNERNRISEEYPYLEKQDGKLTAWALGAKNIKNQLARAFPGIHFSVRSKSYAGGCSIGVSWKNGPTRKQVEETTNRYEEGYFDGMNDIYEYDHDNVWPSVFGGALYVFHYRGYEDGIERNLVRELCNFTNTEYSDEQWSSVRIHDEYAVRIVRQILDRTEIPPAHRIAGLERTECTAGEYHSFYRVITESPEADMDTSAESGALLTVTHNAERNGIELRFSAKPGKDLISVLKSHKWRWSPRGHLWYTKYSDGAMEFAKSLLISD